MTYQYGQAVTPQAAVPGDAEALRYLEEAITGGRHWYLALLEAMGLWASAGEEYEGRSYRYLIDGEAFDWRQLAERMCAAVNGLLPQDEKEAFLFQGKLPLKLGAEEVKELIGDVKYRQYLNYFYGVTVEEFLFLAVQDEVYKERQVLGRNDVRQIAEEAFQRIYGEARTALLRRFRQERGCGASRSITLGELREYTYWLFKYRLKHCEKARVASDTKKALAYLKAQWVKKGFCGVLAADVSPDQQDI